MADGQVSIRGLVPIRGCRIGFAVLAVAMPPQHELLEQEEREQAREHGDHHPLRGRVLEGVRQQLEEHRAEQCADGEAHETSDARWMQRERARSRDDREHAACEAGKHGGEEGRHRHGGRQSSAIQISAAMRPASWARR